MKLPFLIIIFTLFTIPLFAQKPLISGKIIRAESNEVLIGANVSVKGTTRGTITDANGRFQIRSTINVGEVILVVKFIGFKDQEKTIKLNGVNEVIDFQLVSNESQLEDVVVTANKAEEFLQKVNVAATVVSSRDIEQRSSYNTLEALKEAPLLLADSWVTSHTSFSLRGLSNSIDNIGFENTVGLYLDDVYYSRPFIFNSTIFDIDRIEILRGPQGTLFGKNTVGGVINIISEKPEFKNSGQAEITVGNYNYAQFRGKYNQVLIKDKLALRLTGAYNQRKGYVDDLNQIAHDANKNAFTGFRASLFFKQKEKFDAEAKFYFGKDNNSEQTLLYKSTDGLEEDDMPVGENPLGVPASEFNTAETNFPQEFYRNQIGAMTKMNLYVGKNTITSITAINNSDDKVLRDLDVTKIDALRWSRKQGLNTFSQELRIASPRDQKFAYIGGLYFLKERISGVDSGTIRNGILPFASKLLNKKINPIADFQETFSAHSTINNISYALFGSSSYQINDRIKLNIGLRFTSETRDYQFYQNINKYKPQTSSISIVDVFAMPIASAKRPLTDKLKDNVLTYDIGLDYKINNYALAYAKYVRGFKGSGFNTSVIASNDVLQFSYHPEFVNSFEAGIKSKLNNRTRINGAVFYTDYKNKQETIDQGASFILVNANRAGGLGAELEVSTMFDKLKIDFSSGLLNMTYKDFVEYDSEGEVVEDFTGNQMIKSPKYTLAVSPQYTMSLRDKYRLIWGATINHTSLSFNEVHNEEPTSRVPATLVNARLSLMPRSGKWSVALWGKNLLNQRFNQHGWEYIFGNVVSVNRPVTFGIETYLNFL
jgi:iron complex outermembrane recepter protein